jgi:mutator protein MutT
MKTHVVKAGVLVDNGKVLIAKRKAGSLAEGTWEFPGGKLEPGETSNECLIREYKEELDIGIEVLEKIGEVFHKYDDYDFSVELELFFIKHIDGEPVLHVHEEIKWVLPEEVENHNFLGAALPLMGQIIEILKNNA